MKQHVGPGLHQLGFFAFNAALYWSHIRLHHSVKDSNPGTAVMAGGCDQTMTRSRDSSSDTHRNVRAFNKAATAARQQRVNRYMAKGEGMKATSHQRRHIALRRRCDGNEEMHNCI